MDLKKMKKTEWFFQSHQLIDQKHFDRVLDLKTAEVRRPPRWEQLTLFLSERWRCRLIVYDKSISKPPNNSVSIYLKHGLACETKYRLHFLRNEVSANGVYLAALYYNKKECSCTQEDM